LSPNADAAYGYIDPIRQVISMTYEFSFKVGTALALSPVQAISPFTLKHSQFMEITR
jgi:hypothetical protein